MANDRRFHIVSKPSDYEVAGRSISAAADALIMAVGQWTENSDEVWLAVRDVKFSDVIGDKTRGEAIRRDTIGFFEARKHYESYGVPWKRGLIFHGPPGNGKTLTIKAIMRSLMERNPRVPTLYIKSIASRVLGPQGALRIIFTKARQAAPCVLVFEDIDSIVTDEVRSYFFNEVDGLEDNNGIVIIGSTNDLDKLDPGLSQRPSRFDRKYNFSPPGFQERLDYCQHWNQKLSNTPLAVLDSTAQSVIALKTDGFTFAYLKEAYVCALLSLARQTSASSKGNEDGHDNDDFATLLQKQIGSLAAEIATQAINLT